MATLLGCELQRPTFPDGGPVDTTPPEIEFTAPAPADTFVTAGTTEDIGLTVHDASGMPSISADVTGAVQFSFPPVRGQTATDTLISMVLPVPVAARSTGRVVVTVTAQDGNDNVSTKAFAFVVK